ncbi:MAG: transposase [Armatimonadetes bacterium]|nr:transposase [Armatimonadota bacterium]
MKYESQALGGEVFVIAVGVRGRSRCSRCGRKGPRYDRLAPRRWRHLDFGTWEVQIEAALARVECPCCGVVVEQVFRLIPNRRHSSTIVSSPRRAAVTNSRCSINTSVRVHGIRPPDPRRPSRSRSSVTNVPGQKCHPCTRVGLREDHHVPVVLMKRFGTWRLSRKWTRVQVFSRGVPKSQPDQCFVSMTKMLATAS